MTKAVRILHLLPMQVQECDTCNHYSFLQDEDIGQLFHVLELFIGDTIP